jgi:hypothetical protein
MTPPGRALAGWWRQLAPHAPVQLWFADLTVFRLDALVRCARAVPLTSVSRLLLNALTVFPSSPAEPLARRLGLTAPVLRGLLADLRHAGFAEADATGVWHPTPAGRAAADAGAFQETSLERRTFCFTADGLTFLPLTAHGQPADADAPPGLLAALSDCAASPAEWKQSHGFPADVTAVVDPAADADVPAWQRVPVCRAEHVALALIQLPDSSILGFATTTDTWALAPDPGLRLAATDALPGLAGPPAEAWAQAWREWCQPVRGAAPEDVAGAALERDGHRLRVRAAPRLLEKLKVSRPEAFRGDGWILAGGGAVRAAAEVEIGAT